MSTNSTIGIEKQTKRIYCHWDGYPSYMLPILNEHYNTVEKIKELIDLGAISMLAPKIKPSENSKHSFNTPEDGVVIAYHRDRGEDLMFEYSKNCEYNYTFNPKTKERIVK